jgi:hypothetical protein
MSRSKDFKNIRDKHRKQKYTTHGDVDDDRDEDVVFNSKSNAIRLAVPMKPPVAARPSMKPHPPRSPAPVSPPAPAGQGSGLDVDYKLNSIIQTIPELDECLNIPSAILFGGFIREVIAGRDIIQYLTQDGGDIDVYINNIDVSCVITFFKTIVEKGGYIVYNAKFSTYCPPSGDRKLGITDVNVSTTDRLADGHYTVNIRYRRHYWIRMDILLYYQSFGATFNNQLTINMLTYSKLRDLTPEYYQLCINDITARRIRCLHPGVLDTKQLSLIYKFYCKGYTLPDTFSALFADPSVFKSIAITISRESVPAIAAYINAWKLVQRCIPTNRGIIPSVMVDNYDHDVYDMHVVRFKEMCVKLSSFLTCIYESKISRTTSDVVVYKKARNAIVVSMLISSGTRYYSDINSYKLRFEHARILGFFNAKTMQPIPDDTLVFSIYDQTYQYVVGEMVTPTKPFSECNDSCAPGIHAFELCIMAQKYN